MRENELMQLADLVNDGSLSFYKKSFKKEFDTSLVSTTLSKMGWTWYTEKNGVEICKAPSQEMVKKRCLDLIEECYNTKKDVCLGSIVCKWNDGKMSLVAEIESWQSV